MHCFRERQLYGIAAWFVWLSIVGSWRHPLAAEISDELTVEFLDQTTARQAIVDDRQAPYFSRLQLREIAALTGRPVAPPLTAAREEARERFQAAARAFSQREADSISWCLQATLRPLQGRYAIFAQVPWRFMKVVDTHCAGFSHTRGDVIIFGQRTVDRFVEARHQGDRQQAAIELGPLLTHEQLHVLQRLQPARFDRLYRDLWGFQRVTLPLPESILVDVIHNPDALRSQWAIAPEISGVEQRWFVAVTRLRGSATVPQMGRDFEDVALEVAFDPDGNPRWVLDDQSEPQIVPLDQLPQLSQTFGTQRGLDHPNEIAAYLLGDLVRDKLRSGDDSASALSDLPAVRAFRDWCQRGLDIDLPRP